MYVKNKKVLQSEVTRGELVRVASELFADRGFAAASLDEIAQKAGLTKGALYHHYRDKRALFEAVVGRVLEEDLSRIQRESKRLAGERHRSSWRRLLALADLFLDGFVEPRQCRVVWIDGPAVLGWERWHSVVGEPTLRRITGIAGVLVERGVVGPRLREPLAQILFGALQEAGLSIAHAADPAARRAEIAPALHWMLERIFLAPEGPG